MKPWWTAPFALLLPLIAGCAQEPPTEVERQAHSLLVELNAAGHFGGAAIVGRGGQIVYEGAFGMADRTRPFTLETAADGASIAKTVTAAAIWRLVGAGSITVDDAVQEHVPEFPYADVTIRHLLSHTAAVPDYDAFQPLLDDGPPVGNLELQALMRRASPRALRTPGTSFSYCNICYDTLALLLERVTGEAYGEYAVQGILGQAGARHAFLRPARFADWPEPRTLGFRSSREGAEVFDVFDNEAFYGGSNIYFSARDLHAWALAWAERRVLSAPLLDAAMAPADIGGHPSALSLSSWYCAPPRDRCYYTGHHQGFFSFAYWDAARGISVALVTNNTMAAPLQPWLMRTLVALAEGRPIDAAPDLPEPEVEADISALSGRYRLAHLGEVHIIASDGGALLRVGDGPTYQLYQVGYETLYAPGLDAYLSFRGESAAPRLVWSSVFSQSDGPRLSR